MSFGRNRAFKSLTDEPKKYRIELTLFGIIGIATVILLGLVWVFILGVLVGRGYQPEKAVPQLERILPQPPAENASDNIPAPAVLKPEELEYYEALKEEPKPEPELPPQIKPAPVPSPQPEPPAVGVSEKQESPPKKNAAVEKPQEAAPKESASAEVAPQQPEPQPQEALQQPEAEPASGAYRYIYQTASFRDIKMAERLKSRIEELGFESTIEISEQGSSTWNRVNVIFVGTPDETDGLKEKLATLGLAKPLLRSKVPQTAQSQ